MGMTVKAEIRPADVQFAAEVRRAMLSAAEATVLPAAVLGAPYESEPRHQVHLRDTARARVGAPTAGGDTVEVSFAAFWAAWQHEHMDWHHEHGHAKFLELAMAEQGKAWLEAVAVQLREVFK